MDSENNDFEPIPYGTVKFFVFLFVVLLTIFIPHYFLWWGFALSVSGFVLMVLYAVLDPIIRRVHLYGKPRRLWRRWGVEGWIRHYWRVNLGMKPSRRKRSG